MNYAGSYEQLSMLLRLLWAAIHAIEALVSSLCIVHYNYYYIDISHQVINILLTKIFAFSLSYKINSMLCV